MTQPVGYSFKLDLSSGRFIPCGDGIASIGEQTCVVTGASDGIHAAATALNAAGAIPVPLGARWKVSYFPT